MTNPMKRTLLALLLSAAALATAGTGGPSAPALAQEASSYADDLVENATRLLSGRRQRDPEQASRLLQAAAEAQHPGAMLLLAQLYIAGDGVEQNLGRAENLLLQAERIAPAAEISFTLGRLYEQPGYANRGKGIAAYQAALDRNYEGPAAAIGLVRTLLSAQPTEEDLERARGLIDQAEAVEATPETMLLRGRLLLRPGPLQDISRAVALLGQVSEAGDVDATLQLAGIYGRGDGVARDQSRAETLYKRAIDLGADTVPVWSALADLYLAPDSSVRDPAQGVVALSRLVELGDNPSRIRLARLLIGGEVPKDFDRARGLLEAYVEAGSVADGSRALGDLYLQQGPLRDPSRAVSYYQASADAGDPAGMLMLARAYANGWGGQVDFTRAIGLANRSIEAGNRRFGLDALGDILLQSNRGDGPQRAADAYGAAVELGNPSSMVKLGRLLFSGRIPPDYSASRAVLEKALDTPQAPQAWTALGDYYLATGNPDRSQEQAEAAFTKAAELGDGPGMVALARLSMERQPTGEDAERVKELLIRAVAAGQVGMGNKLLGDLAMRHPAPDGDRQAALAAYTAAAAAGNGDAHLMAAKLEADGFRDPQTRIRVQGHLYSARVMLGPTGVAVEMLRMPRQTLVGLTQQLLQAAGIAVAVDGSHGPATAAAIREFCELRQLAPCETAFITVGLLEELLTRRPTEQARVGE